MSGALGLDPVLWQVLACPVDHAAVVPDEAAHAVACTSCGRRYPVRDGIPVMLETDADTGAETGQADR